MTPPAPVVLVFLDPAFPDGRIADAAQPQLLVTDQGATRGDGIFETMLAAGGTVRKIQAHLDRLAGSAEALDLVIPGEAEWRRAIATGLSRHHAEHPPALSGDELVVKLVVTRGPEGAGPISWVQVSPVGAAVSNQRRTGLDVILLDRGYDSEIGERAPWLLLGAKTLSYAVNMAALRHARKQGADDVIFISSDGRVLEGPTSTVLMAHVEAVGPGASVKRLITPQLDSGILPGTSQGALFAAAKAAGWELGYGPLEPRDLMDADAVWLISSVRGLAPVNRIDGEDIGEASLQKELTAELNGLFAGIE